MRHTVRKPLSVAVTASCDSVLLLSLAPSIFMNSRLHEAVVSAATYAAILVMFLVHWVFLALSRLQSRVGVVYNWE
jgi:L-cystine uptake protein TcyP (sodium:dicarboxylate symporter family)